MCERAETVASILARARRALRSSPHEATPREARLLLARALDWPEARILAHPEHRVDAESLLRFEDWLSRRLRGEPVAYLLGEREFYGRVFTVDRRVLVPRPETEHLVERALAVRLPADARVLDIGTGSGCIAATLALERPAWRLYGSDLSTAALAVARHNVLRHRLAGRLRLVGADLTTALRLDRFDLVVSNPPYIDPEAADSYAAAVRDHEPSLALFGGRDGTTVYRSLFEAMRRLPKAVPLLVEIGSEQLDSLHALARRHGLVVDFVGEDLAGHPRVLELHRTA